MDHSPPTAAFVTEHWPLSGITFGQVFGTGRFSRRVFMVSSDQGTFAMKVNDNPPAPEQAMKELDVLGYLAERGYRHAPALLPTREGAPLVHTGERSVVILEFIPGRFDPDGPPSPKDWQALGGAMATLNTYVDYQHDFAQRFVDNVPDQLREQVQGHPIEAEFLRLLDRVEPLKRSPQRSLVHGEVNYANSGYRADGSVVLLDWDGTGTGPTALDHGYPLITQFIDQFDRTFHREVAEAFYGAYRDAGGVVDVDLAMLAALFQAMFLMWFFNTDGRWKRIQWALQNEANAALCHRERDREVVLALTP